MKTKFYYLSIAVFTCLFFGCKKDWLEEKRSLSVIVPTTLKDLRLILNNELPLNYDTRGITEVSSDDVFVTDDMFNTLEINYERNAYKWEREIFESTPVVSEWDVAYQQILYANVVLEGVKKIERTSSNGSEYDDILGSALFIRSRAFLNLVMTFAKYYDASTSNSDPGIPLKLTSDINEKISRASVQQVYDQIEKDLTTATKLLSLSPSTVTNPGKAAAFGLLARCKLYMGNYQAALDAATSSYQLKNNIIDFNTVSTASTYPFSSSASEIHIYSRITRAYYTQSISYSAIDNDLYNSYSDNDLRKTVFFLLRSNTPRFRGGYVGGIALFGATATDEILLIKAECKARLNNVTGAMEDLNTLLIKRFKAGTFSPLMANNAEEALKIILTERRKELLRRGLRWQDLKRLNRDSRFAKTLTRVIGGITYTLPPNDPRYIIPIPDYVIQRDGIAQNKR